MPMMLLLLQVLLTITEDVHEQRKRPIEALFNIWSRIVTLVQLMSINCP
ncbi:hypothetical protein ES705_41269 [subsurface metagenome]